MEEIPVDIREGVNVVGTLAGSIVDNRKRTFGVLSRLAYRM